MVVFVTAILGVAHAWTADDGFITLRVARNIAAGHGPVFNMGERVEASTSPLWTWLLGAVAWMAPHSLETWAVVIGVLMATGGVALMMLGCLRAAPADGRVVLPGAVVILLCLRSFWEFESSGLDIALTVLWVGLAWWACVRAAGGTQHSITAAAAVLGLAPIVRAELVLAALLIFVVLIRGSGHSWKLPVALLLLPGLAYEVFRAVYYATLVPTTALAKEGSRPRLDMVGLHYMWTSWFVSLAFIPVVCLLIFRSGLRSAPRRLSYAFLAAGALEAAYVVMVGGDYMIGRLLLPALALMVAPFAVVRVEPRRVVPALALLILATLVPPVAQIHLLPNPDENFGARKNWIVQEARYLQKETGVSRPYRLVDYSGSYVLSDIARSYEPNGRLVEPGGAWKPLPDPLSRSVVTTTILGLTSYVLPLGVYVIDLNGLADPVTARLRLDQRGRPGHEKRIGDAFAETRFGIDHTDEVPDPKVCNDIKRLYRDIRSPMTFGRAWTNLTHAFSNTTMRLRIRDAAGTCAPIPV